jgi:hypothetical protein
MDDLRVYTQELETTMRRADSAISNASRLPTSPSFRAGYDVA